MAVALRALAFLLLDEDDNENENKERIWVRPWIASRPQFGAYHSLFHELKKDEQSFKQFIRMDVSQFDFLVEKLAPKILKEDTFMRDSIQPEEMLCLTLRYLASGESFRSLQFQFRLGRKTVCRTLTFVPQFLKR